MRTFRLTSVLGCLALVSIFTLLPSRSHSSEHPQISGIYPHLAMFNSHGECGTGAVVPWAGRLWVVTYAPHQPFGSTDKLYEITPELKQIVRPESIGGTPANRMIHEESQQLFIASYAIDNRGNVRVIPFKSMPGRMTGTARHLTDPQNKVYMATMEEGFYEIDVATLHVTTLYADSHVLGKKENTAPGAKLPGYHGKGLYSGQGVLVYANNGEKSREAQRKPFIPSGVLATWDGSEWEHVRRNQFTEVTGPGGIYGNQHPETDPIWTLGWDHKSVLLMLLDGNVWHTFRLPKGSHSYDGAHGWNTEWPRIREIGDPDEMLATMHGTFWRFPASFSIGNTAGIAPRSNYLKIVGDFCKWQDKIVLGCDDAAASAFLNKKKSHAAAAGQSQSNLWFVDADKLDQLGPAIGRGAVWQGEDLQRLQWSDPYLASGYDHRGLHIVHATDQKVEFELQVDRLGRGEWQTAKKIEVPANSYQWISLDDQKDAVWFRLIAQTDCKNATAVFQYANRDQRSTTADAMFDGLSAVGTTDNSSQGVLWAHGKNRRTLGYLHQSDFKEPAAYYQLNQSLELSRVDSSTLDHAPLVANAAANAALTKHSAKVDKASAIYVDGQGKRWRLPRGDQHFDAVMDQVRIEREVVTERNLVNLHGTFYELPADNAGGVAKIRPIASHNKFITDFSSYCGMLVMSGVDADAEGEHIIRSADSKAAVWAGVIDDLWKLGKPRGVGGPWFETAVTAGEPSDPYLMTGYDKKSFTLSHKSDHELLFVIQIDFTGDGSYQDWMAYSIPPGNTTQYQFPEGFHAYWLRVVSSEDCVATAQFTYE